MALSLDERGIVKYFLFSEANYIMVPNSSVSVICDESIQPEFRSLNWCYEKRGTTSQHLSCLCMLWYPWWAQYQPESHNQCYRHTRVLGFMKKLGVENEVMMETNTSSRAATATRVQCFNEETRVRYLRLDPQPSRLASWTPARVSYHEVRTKCNLGRRLYRMTASILNAYRLVGAELVFYFTRL